VKANTQMDGKLSIRVKINFFLGEMKYKLLYKDKMNLCILFNQLMGSPVIFMSAPINRLLGFSSLCCVSTPLTVTVVFFSLAGPKIVRGWGGRLDIFSPKHCHLEFYDLTGNTRQACHS